MLLDTVEVLPLELLKHRNLIPQLQFGAPGNNGLPVLLQNLFFIPASLTENFHPRLQFFHRNQPNRCFLEKTLCHAIFLQEFENQIARLFNQNSI